MKFSKLLTMIGIVTVLALGSVARAGVIITVTPLGSPAAGLEAFKVTAVGTGGLDVGSIASLSLTGSVHQVWENAIAASKSTVAGDLAAGTFGNPAWEALDTHLLVDPSAGHLLSPGFGVDENNDVTNPAGLAPLLPANPAFVGFPGRAGLGDLFFTGVAPQITLNPFAAAVDFLQVVVPTGQTALLDVRFIDSSSSGFIDYTNFVIPVPEPASLVLLGLGSMAVVSRRRRA